MKYLEDFSWVSRGKQRSAILCVMDKPRTPTQIWKQAKEINPKLTLNNTSDVLKEFKEKGLAKCLNPKEKMGRVYVLSSKGKVVRKEMV